MIFMDFENVTVEIGRPASARVTRPSDLVARGCRIIAKFVTTSQIQGLQGTASFQIMSFLL